MTFRPFKRLLKHPATHAVLCALMAGYIRLLGWTLRMRMESDPASEPYVSGEKQAIFAFWHGRLLLCSLVIPKGRTMHVLISGHNDGQLISRVIAHFGIRTVEGSSNRNSTAALRGLLKLAKAGDNLAITPDGPRGPRQQAAPGIVFVAQATGLPVVPCSWSAAPHKRLGSWDRFMIPLPFSRARFMVDAPMIIPKDQPVEAACAQVETRLNHMTEMADEAVGVAPV